MAQLKAPTSEVQEQLINSLNKLRKEQRFFSTKISDFENDIKERKLVIEALKDINDLKRPCYRLLGDVLVGRTIGEVLPVLEKTIEQINILQEQYKEKLVQKGQEINTFMEKNNIRAVANDGRVIEKEIGKDEVKSLPSNAVLIENR